MKKERPTASGLWKETEDRMRVIKSHIGGVVLLIIVGALVVFGFAVNAKPDVGERGALHPRKSSVRIKSSSSYSHTASSVSNEENGKGDALPGGEKIDKNDPFDSKFLENRKVIIESAKFVLSVYSRAPSMSEGERKALSKMRELAEDKIPFYYPFEFGWVLPPQGSPYQQGLGFPEDLKKEVATSPAILGMFLMFQMSTAANLGSAYAYQSFDREAKLLAGYEVMAKYLIVLEKQAIKLDPQNAEELSIVLSLENFKLLFRGNKHEWKEKVLRAYYRDLI